MTPDRSTRVKNTADNTPAIVELTLSRFREFYREPEAVFWVVHLSHSARRGTGYRISESAR